MNGTEIRSLLQAVRRHLWRQRVGAAVRAALWATAALLLAAVALHLATRRVQAEPVLMLAALIWLLMPAWAATRAPSPADCALWADRHLGGQSAFSTLLQPGNTAKPDAAALRWLGSWAAAQAPQSQRLLAERQASTRLARPLLAMLVCAGLAALVQSLWHDVPSPRRPVGASSSERADSAAPAVDARAGDTPAATADVSPAPAARGDAGQAAARQKPADGTEAFNPLAVAGPAAEASGAAASNAASASVADDGSAAARNSGGAAGREAGDARDERSSTGLSRAAPGLPQAPRPGTGAYERPARQADMGEVATYDEALQGPDNAGTGRFADAVAAAPPAARASTRLTPTETTYVQAWMRANAHHR
jgi:hypothetical protein